MALNDAYGQGTVVFVTSILGSSAKVLESSGFPGAGQALGNTAAGVAPGSQFLAQLYVWAGSVSTSAQLVPVGSPVNFRAGTGNGGYVLESGNTTLGAPVNTTVTIPASVLPLPGGGVTVQLRAWWAGAGGNTYQTYESARDSGNVSMRVGASPLLYLPATGNPMAQPSGTPVNLTGLSGFQLGMGWWPYPPPTIVSGPVSQVIQAGSNATFSVSALAATYYQWRKTLTPIPGAISTSYVITNATLASAGFYDVVVGGSGGTISTGATLTVYIPVSFTSQPVSQTVPLYGTAVFQSAATGYPLPSYQWRLNGVAVPGANNATLTLPSVTVNQLGLYSVVASNQYSVATSSVAALNMSPSLNAPLVSTTAIWGRQATLSVGAVGSGPLAYQWYKDGQAVTDATNSSLHLPSVQVSDGGIYSVVVSSAFGVVTNAPAQLFISTADVALTLHDAVRIDGVPGHIYGIQYSTDLTDTNSWVALTNLTLTQPVQTWVDTSVDAHAPGTLKRYYRVIAP